MKDKSSGNLVKYGIGDEYDFSWDEKLSEEENYKRIDLATTNALFKQVKMTFDLKKAGFDLGIGGMGYSNSLFFRDM